MALTITGEEKKGEQGKKANPNIEQLYSFWGGSQARRRGFEGGFWGGLERRDDVGGREPDGSEEPQVPEERRGPYGQGFGSGGLVPRAGRWDGQGVVEFHTRHARRVPPRKIQQPL